MTLTFASADEIFRKIETLNQRIARNSTEMLAKTVPSWLMVSMAAALEIGIYREALVFLGTAGVMIPLMARLRVSPVVGFLVAGLLLGPNSLGRLDDAWPWLGWITITSQDAVDRLAELGVAFLLFTIGLELSFDRLWTMRRLVFGLGMSQVVLTTAAIGAVTLAFGNPVEASLVIGACLALSSTAIVLQLLADQQRLTSVTGRSIFAVLLAQDLAVVPILFLIVVFGGTVAEGGATTIVAKSVWAGLGLALMQAAAAIFLIIGIGRLILRRLFRSVARTHNRELFMATILFVVVRGGPGCLNRFSASISGASAGVRLPCGWAAG